MNTLLVKDLSRADELDRAALKAVHGGALTVAHPSVQDPIVTLPGTAHPWPLPPSFPHAGGWGGDPVYQPYTPPPEDPRALPAHVVAV
jgi:hypothetical protein